MKKLKSLIAIVLVVLLALSCVACAGGDAAGNKKRATTAAKKNGEMTVSLNDQVTTFDPYLFKVSVEDSVIAQMYEPLFIVDNDGNNVWLAAEAVEVNDDGSEAVITLRKGNKFHSGDELKAEDVLYSFARAPYSTLAATLAAASTMEEVDEYTVKMTFPMAAEGYNYAALLPYIMTLRIVNKSYCESIIGDQLDGDLKFNVDGSGPFKFESVSDNGDVKIVKNENYYQEVKLNAINYKYLSGSEETAFESGDLDIAAYTGSTFSLLDQYSNVAKESYSVNNITFLINNCVPGGGSPTEDKRVREAIVYAMNREDVCTIGSEDAGTVAYNLANPLITYYSADACTKYTQDLDKATQLLAEAGYNESNKCELTLIVMPAQPSWVAACEVLKETLEQTNFVINIEQVADTARFFTYDFDIGFISLALTSNFASYGDLFRTESGLNLAGLEDADVLAAFDSMTDEATTHNAMKVATESHAYIPLFYNTYFYAFDSDLEYGPMYREISGFLYRDFGWKK